MSPRKLSQKGAGVLERLTGFVRSLDPKLLATVAGIALTRGVLALGGDPIGDPLWSGAIALALGALAGYVVPNAGSALRKRQTGAG